MTSLQADDADILIWAQEEFGRAELGNSARVKRLIRVGAQAATRPAGKLTEVFTEAAEREAAFRLMENVNVKAQSIAKAAWLSSAHRCRNEPFVYVPIDSSSLTLTDRKRSKGHGIIGSKHGHLRGALVMSAIAVTPSGIPLGIAGQRWWARSENRVQKHRVHRSVWQKETRYWLDVIDDVNSTFSDAEVSTRRWFQCDAAASFRELFQFATETDQLITIRSSQKRVVINEKERYLGDALKASAILGTYSLEIPKGGKRIPRTATMVVRARHVNLQPVHAYKSGRAALALYAVFTQEVGTTPENEKPIEWMLLTNFVVTNFAEASQVISGYTHRWSVEEFHKTWKTCCKVEESQLDYVNFISWATILASVAMRAEMLKQAARCTPDVPATEQFTPQEIQAVILLRNPKKRNVNQPPTLAEVVRWVADLGGYVGKSSGGPPGSITIARGLKYLEPAVIAISRLKKEGKLG